MDETQALHLAREAIQQGDKAAGQRLLLQAIRSNPHNEIPWLWLSAIVDDPGKERDCLERVLKINPDNEVAQQHLAKLDRPKTQETQLVATEPQAELAVQTPTAQDSSKQIGYLVIGSLAVFLFGCVGSIITASTTSGYGEDTAVYQMLALGTVGLGLLSIVGGFGAIAGIFVGSRSKQTQTVKSRSSVTVVTTYASAKPLTIEQRRERLQRAIGEYASRGYLLTSQTETSAQMVKKKRFSCLSAFLLLFTLFGWIVYLLYYWSKRDEIAYLYVDEHGNLIVR